MEQKRIMGLHQSNGTGSGPHPTRGKSILPPEVKQALANRPVNATEKTDQLPSGQSDSHIGSSRRRRFEDKYNRVTTYIRCDLDEEVRRRYNAEEISSYTAFFNDAIETFLKRGRH